MTVSKIISLRIEQEYYNSGHARNLRFSPSPQTQKLIKQNALRLKYNESGFDLFISKREENEIITLKENILLDFAIYSSDPYFRTHTSLEEIPSKNILYSNKNNLLKSADLIPEFIDQTGMENDMQFIAITQITLNNENINNTVGLNYRFRWAGAGHQWRYYYIGRKNFPSPDIIHDEIQFEKEAVQKDNDLYNNDELARDLYNYYPNAQHWVFISQKNVIWKEKSYKDIRLLRDNEIIISHLPNPLQEQNGKHIINALTN